MISMNNKTLWQPEQKLTSTSKMAAGSDKSLTQTEKASLTAARFLHQPTFGALSSSSDEEEF